jgi:acetyltransferase-like isoleucine patch superfamily enzyme
MSLLSKINAFFPTRFSLGSCGCNSKIQWPAYITKPKSLHLEDDVFIRRNVCISNTSNEIIYIKKYTVIAYNCTIITANHRSTVGIPQILLGISHINDKSRNLSICEDVWVGINVTIMPGADIGRGAIVGACSTVTKPVPPYALVVGSPARIVGVKFTIDQILEHEKALYPENERFSREYLEGLFSKYYEGMKVFGVQTMLTNEDLAALDKAKKQRKFIGPKL